MKRLAFLCLLCLVLVGAGPTSRKPPATVSCLAVAIDGQELVTNLPREIPATPEALGKGFAQVGNLIKAYGAMTGDPAAIRRGERILEAAKTGDWSTGYVCFVEKAYCGPHCWGQGCGRIIVIDSLVGPLDGPNPPPGATHSPGEVRK